MDFPDRLAAALGVALDDAIVNEVLDLARDVAHGTERRFAPVTAFVAGVYAGARVAAGTALPDAVAQARQTANELLNAAD